MIRTKYMAILLLLLIASCSVATTVSDETPLLSDNPPSESALTLYARGSYLFEQGDLAGAEKALKQVLASDPRAIRAKAKLVEVYLAQDHIRKAHALALEVLPHYKDDLYFLILIAKIEASRGKMDAAQKYLIHAKELDPNNDEIPLILWRVEAELGNFDAAVRELEKLAAKYPDAAQIRFWIGLIKETAGKPVEAQAEFEKTLELDPNNIPSMIKLGHMALRGGDTVKAEKYFRRVLDLDPGNVEALQGIAVINGEDFKGPLPGGIDELGLRVAIDLIENDKLEEAVRELERIRAKHPDNKLVAFFLGIAYEGMGELEKASEIYISIPPESSVYPQARFRYAVTLAMMKRIDEAMRQSETLLVEYPEMTEAAVLLANLYIEKNRPEKAIELLELVTKSHPKNKLAILTLGNAYYESGRIDDSIKTMRRLLEIDPENAEAMNFIGYAFAERGERLDEAELLILKAMKLKPGSAAITDSLGWVYYQRGEYGKAATILQTAHGLNPAEPVIAEHLGDAYLKTGKKEKAVKLYRKALESNPKPDQLKRIGGKINSLQKP